MRSYFLKLRLGRLGLSAVLAECVFFVATFRRATEIESANHIISDFYSLWYMLTIIVFAVGGRSYNFGTSDSRWLGHTQDLLTRTSGEEGNFDIIIREYIPPFTRCANTPAAARPSTTACQQIIDTMNAGTDQTTFGAQGVAGVQVHLPMVLTDRESSLPHALLISSRFLHT